MKVSPFAMYSVLRVIELNDSVTSVITGIEQKSNSIKLSPEILEQRIIVPGAPYLIFNCYLLSFSPIMLY